MERIAECNLPNKQNREHKLSRHLAAYSETVKPFKEDCCHIMVMTKKLFYLELFVGYLMQLHCFSMQIKTTQSSTDFFVVLKYIFTL